MDVVAGGYIDVHRVVADLWRSKKKIADLEAILSGVLAAHPEARPTAEKISKNLEHGQSSRTES